MVMPKVKNTEIPTNSGGSAKGPGGLTVNTAQTMFVRVVNPHRDRSMSLLLLTLIIEHQLGLVERWVLPDNSCITIHVDIFVYYMAIVASMHTLIG